MKWKPWVSPVLLLTLSVPPAEHSTAWLARADQIAAAVERIEAVVAPASVAPSAGGGAVFQYLGELDRPGMIGRVEPGGRWTRFDLFREDSELTDSPPVDFEKEFRVRSRVVDNRAKIFRRHIRAAKVGEQGHVVGVAEGVGCVREAAA